MAEIRDGVEVVWSYRPDDRSKQGTTEVLPRDLAEMKVREGLARWPEVKPDMGGQLKSGVASVTNGGDAEKVDPGTIVTDASTGRSSRVAGTHTRE